MATITAYLTRFTGPGYGDHAVQTREIEIPDHEIAQAKNFGDVLGLAFRYGQNETQPQALPSLSVGDVLKIDNVYEGVEFYRVLPVGFWRERRTLASKINGAAAEDRAYKLAAFARENPKNIGHNLHRRDASIAAL